MSLDLSTGTLAQLACLLEATARKPGNVHPWEDFEDTTFLDFALSALAIGPALDRAAGRGVGAMVLDAVASTRRVVATNTNLGMVLLLAPLAAVAREVPLREGVADVLSATTVDDARLVYRAIRLARPGGLGQATEQDVTAEPTQTLVDVMALAADRDTVARQYANSFGEVFDVGVPALRGALAAGRPLETAVIATHLRLLAEVPDTLIARKCGPDESREAARRAADVLRDGWPDSTTGILSCARLDRWLRARGHARNPGTTADLVAAALFVCLRDGTIRLPVTGGRSGWSSAGR
jgi:triphosphoribosyl-dephospho-CoA synthase